MEDKIMPKYLLHSNIIGEKKKKKTMKKLFAGRGFENNRNKRKKRNSTKKREGKLWMRPRPRKDCGSMGTDR